MNSWINSLNQKSDSEEIKKILEQREVFWTHPPNIKFKELLNKNFIFPKSQVSFTDSHIKIESQTALNEKCQNEVIKDLELLIPWKKGPFEIHGHFIDAEWRSDFKWNRLLENLDSLEGKRILDIGCNNGYFMFQMAKYQPAMVLGIDPVVPFKAQFEYINKHAQLSNLHHELLGVEHLNLFHEEFDIIFNMGVIYHHRHPIEQLLFCKDALKPGGQLILETIGIPGDQSYALFPEDRYARMGNIWFVPTLSCLINWTKKAKFVDVELISDSDLTEDEQRLTKWCPPPRQSLLDSLNPENNNLTIEGHPAPRRFCIRARKKG